MRMCFDKHLCYELKQSFGVSSNLNLDKEPIWFIAYSLCVQEISINASGQGE